MVPLGRWNYSVVKVLEIWIKRNRNSTTSSLGLTTAFTSVELHFTYGHADWLIASRAFRRTETHTRLADMTQVNMRDNKRQQHKHTHSHTQSPLAVVCC